MVEDGKNKREKWIDCVKGIAIILVIWGHIDFNENFLCVWIYSFHIPIFFIVSGILMNIKNKWKEENTKRLIIKRLKQLIYPYITFSIIVLIYYLIRMNSQESLEIILKTIFLEGYSTLWFLPAIFMAECLFILMQKKNVNNIIGMIVLFIVSVIGVHIYNNVIEQSSIMLIVLKAINILNRVIIGTIFIFLGYKGYEVIKKFETKNKTNLLCLLSVVFFVINVFISQQNGLVDLHYSKLNNPILYYICAILGAWSLILIIKYIVIKCKVLEFFGKNSLIIMATHLPLPVIAIADKTTFMISNNIIKNILELLIVLILELAIIYIINRFGKFLIRYPEKKIHIEY